MRNLALLLMVFSLLLTSCGTDDTSCIEENESQLNLSENGETVDQAALVSVFCGRGVYGGVLWVCCSPAVNNSWGNQYQPVQEGDTISFQVEPGIAYDLKCMTSELNQCFKWSVTIMSDGYTWEVTESDPDNLFRNFSHPSDSNKNIGLVTVSNTHGCGVISSLVTSHQGYSGEVVVEHLNNMFLQPNSQFALRLRAGITYDVKISNTYGDVFFFQNLRVDGDLTLELTDQNLIPGNF